MIKSDISLYDKGWIVGNFSPAIKKTVDFEVAVKYYKKGDKEKKHVHNIAQEITVIVEGCVKMNDTYFYKGQICILEPGESADFEALKDTATMVLKIPSVIGDKYYV